MNDHVFRDGTYDGHGPISLNFGHECLPDDRLTAPSICPTYPYYLKGYRMLVNNLFQKKFYQGFIFEWLASSLNCLIGLTALFMLALSFYLIPRGFFNGDSGIMYFVFEKPDQNPFLTATPFIFRSLDFLKIEPVFLRYFRFIISLILSGIIFFLFALWSTKKFNIYFDKYQAVTVFFLTLLGGTMFPMQFLAWPFYHHDLILWCVYLVIIFYFISDIYPKNLILVTTSFSTGFVVAVDFFCKPSSGLLFFVIISFFYIFKFPKIMTKFFYLIFFMSGILFFTVYYFGMIQPYSSWIKMVRFGLERIQAMQESLGRPDYFSTSLIAYILRTINDFYSILTNPFVELKKYTSNLFYIFLLCITTTCFTFIVYKTLKQRHLCTQFYTDIILRTSYYSSACLVGLIYIYCLDVYIINGILSSRQVGLNLDTSFLVLWAAILYGYTKLRQNIYGLETVPSTFIRHFLLLAISAYFAAQAGSNQTLQHYGFEYLFLLILFFYSLYLRYFGTSQRHKNLFFTIFFLPITVFLLFNFNSQFVFYYKSFENIKNFKYKLPYSSRTKKILLDEDTYNLISKIHEILKSKTTFKFGDSFFAFNNLSREIYLLGGYTWLMDHSYNGKFIRSSFYINYIKQLNAPWINASFLLLNTEEVEGLKDFFQKINLNFTNDYLFIGEVDAHPSYPFKISIFVPKTKMKQLY